MMHRGYDDTRRSFLRRTGCAALFAAGSAPVWGQTKTSPAKRDDEILAQCPARIREYRTGDGAISVKTSDGKPVAGARVRLRQTRHEFLFGCNFFNFDRFDDPALQQAYNDRFATLLNYATLGFYWPMYEPVRGQPSHGKIRKAAEWCKSRGIVCKGHPLVWDFADPKWLPREFEDIRRLSHERVADCIRTFAGLIDRWDVVNEPTHLGRFGTRMGEWAQSLGAVPYVRQHLETARAAGPKATLLVNDYRVDPPFYAILDQLRDGGNRLMFDTVGIQSHMHRGAWPMEKVWRVCDEFARLGLPLHFTETTVVSGAFLGRDETRPARGGDNERWGETTPELEERQADQVARFYTALFAHPAVEAVTWWDFSDARAWKKAAAGLIRKDMSPKPVYERLASLIKKEWQSTFEGRTDEQGRIRPRLFYGDYEAVVALPDGREVRKSANWPRRADRNVEVVV